MTRAIHDVEAERHRQVFEEGYTEQHDDTHINGELALAAMAYACPEHVMQWFYANDIRLWPFEGEPNLKNRRRDLERAAAFLIAEMERLDRAITLATSQERSEEHTSELQSLMRNSYAVL